MPRKTQFNTEDVITAALELVRQKGLAGLSAPAVADKLGCSTMPIYSQFKNMQALEDEIVKRSWERVMAYQVKRYTGDTWIDHAIGYVRFAREENNLFRCMLDGRNLELKFDMHIEHWELLSKSLEGYEGFNGLTDEQRLRVRYTRSMLAHGVAMSANIGMNKIIFENDKMLSTFLTSASQVLLKGYREAPPLDEAVKAYFLNR